VFPGDDDDLIAWWNGLKRGEGSDQVKQALRTFIGGRPAGGGIQIPEPMPIQEEVEPVVMDDRQEQERRQHMLSRKW